MAATQPSVPAPSIPGPKLTMTQATPVARAPRQTTAPAGPSISAVPRQPAPLQKPAPAPAPLPPNAIKLPTIPAAPPPQPAPAATPFVATPFPGTNEARISISLAKVCQKWPAQVRSQIQQLGATDVELPVSVIEG